jgi:flagellar biosynthesis/type III secretory pathway M-ring protein FliF/YscJ
VYLAPFIVGLFLYFPEDKSEYIPAAFSFLIFLIMAIIVMRIIIKVSKRELEKAKEVEEKMKKWNEENPSEK